MKKTLESPFLKRSARVEMVSLMDVMFLVLVFFVYAVFNMAVHRGLKVDLPAAEGVFEKGERAVVTIDSKDALQLNGRALTRDELVKETARLVAARPGTPVIISGDRRASLGAGIELLARLKAAGVEKASFQVSGKASGEN
jgi:biopolymer transport protein ExbD